MVGAIDFRPYLQSLCHHYAEWWTLYTLTDIKGKKASNRDEPKRVAPFNFELMVQSVKNKAPDPSRQEQFEKTERQPVLKGLRDSLTENKQVLLIGRPGSGKSTALARLLLEEAQQRQKTIEELSRIPVLVELRYYQTSVIDLIREFFKRHDLLLETHQVETLLSRNQLLLLIDGLNELSSKEAARQDIAKLRNYRHVPMIFTTRDLSLGGDFGIEKQWEMLPLTETQMQAFIRSHLSPEQADAMWRQLKDRTRKFAKTPLLLWMLCELFEAGEEIPRNLGEVFRIFTRTYENSSIRKYEVAALKGDVQPLSDRRLWFPALKHLAYMMMQGATPVDSRPVISRGEAEQEFKALFRDEPHSAKTARDCLDDLLNHHLLQIKIDDEIEFRHQLIQEYYAAEWLLDRLSELSDEQLKYYFLNYLKWTEAIGLMLGLLEVIEERALAIVELALNEVDLMLGAKLAGEVKPQLQVQSISLIRKQQIPELVKVHLLGATRSNYATSDLVHALLQHENLTLSTDAAIMLWNLGSLALVDELLNLLDHDNYIVRANAAFAALGLREIDNDRIISRLAEALQDEHEHEYFRESAAETLSALGNLKAIPALISALQDSSMRIREKAVEGLGNLNDPIAFEPLLKIALEDQPLIIQWYAARALGKIDAKAAMQKFLEVVENGNYKMRERAAEAIENLESEEVIPILVEILENYKEYRYSYIYSKAVKGLERIGTEAAIQGLIQVLQHPDFNICSAAINALGSLGNQTVIPKLIEMLEDPNLDVHEEVAFALGRLGSKAAIPKLIEFFVKKPNRMVPEKTDGTAARLLGDLGDQIAIPCLLEAVKESKSRDSKPCGIVLKALGKLGCEEIIPELFKRLEEDRSWVKNEVIDGLASLNNQVVRSRLCKLLEHSDRELRINAAKVLSKLGDITTIEHLRKALDDPDLEVRLYVMDALGALCDFVFIPRLWQMQLIEETDTSFLSTIKVIQRDSCQFYNYEIATQSPPPPVVRQESGVGHQGQTTNNYFNIENLNANHSPLNLGGTVRDQLINQHHKPEP